MTRTCVVIAEARVRDAIRRGRSWLSRGADLVEIRLDYLSDLTEDGLDRLARALGGSAVATLRSVAQGGKSRGPRREWLLRAARAGFGLVDVETVADRKDMETIRRTGARIIASHHYFDHRPPGEISRMLDRCCRAGDIGKVAVTPSSVAAAAGIVEMGIACRRRFVLIGMGQHGAVTRALAERMGCDLQYARPDRGPGTAPGQLTITEWNRIRGGRPILTGLVGYPLGHSVSQVMQNAAFRSLGLPGIYLPFEAKGMRDLRSLLQVTGLRGLNVTMPHKERLMPLLDRVDVEARAIGAVNTISISRGRAVGHNTDTYGFGKLLRKAGVIRAHRALVIGAGGAARAVLRVLRGEILITNRTLARARRIAGGARVIPPGDILRCRPYDLVVNCTPLGQAGQRRRSIIPAAIFGRGVTLVDLVYNPLETATMRAARRKGARAVGGLEMLVQQGARSFEIWTGEKAPVRAMRAAAREAILASQREST